MLTERPNRAPIGFARRHRDFLAIEEPQAAPLLSTRFAAFVIDWVLCIVLVDGLLGALHVLRAPLIVMALLGGLTLIAYFTAFWSLGRSPGMRLMGLRAIDSVTGAPPPLLAALVRSILTVPGGAAGIMLGLYLYVGSLGQDPAKGTGLAYTSGIGVLLVVAVPYVIVAALALRDPGRRMLHDRISRIDIVDASAAAD